MAHENPSGMQTEREAIAWFTRMNGKPSRAERRHFDDWRKSPAHAETYDRIAAIWSSAGKTDISVTDGDKSAVAAHLRKVEELRRQRRNGTAGTVALTLLLLLGGAGWLWLEKPHMLEDLRADYVATRGERRTVELPDGSTVLLDADSAIAVDVTDRERRVDLLRGTAFFEVRQSGVPFIVEAANGQSRVLGTAFDISVTPEGTSVTLARGSLEVSLSDASGKVILKPGENVVYGGNGLGTPAPVDLSEVMGWREGRLVFNNMPLASVLSHIERNRKGRIMLIGGSMADRRISGSLALDDTDAALDAVQSIAGFRMQKLGDLVIIHP